jgi:hypothetical protein
VWTIPVTPGANSLKRVSPRPHELVRAGTEGAVGVPEGAIICFNHCYRSLTTITIIKQITFYLKNDP